MPKSSKSSGRATQVHELRSQIDELKETLRAIRMGEVDALLVTGPRGDQVFTLQGAEHPYRVWSKPLTKAQQAWLLTGRSSMRERLRQLGGQLDVDFGREGTRVHAVLVARNLDQKLTGEFNFDDGPGSTDGIVVDTNVPADLRKRILIADDHPVVLQAVRDLIGAHEQWTICGEAIDGNEVVHKARKLSPDLIILDINMPGLSGIGAAVQVLKDNPNAKILFFTAHDSEQVIREVTLLGAQECVSKLRAGKDLAQAVKLIFAGQKVDRSVAASSR
jgi:CheY-like chemotaxis protein